MKTLAHTGRAKTEVQCLPVYLKIMIRWLWRSEASSVPIHETHPNV